MEIKYLQVLVMPNKEILCEGKTIGFLDKFGQYIKSEDEMLETGRLSVLKEFDDMCQADAFVGFSDEEWRAIKRFFAFNKEISGWDKK